MAPVEIDHVPRSIIAPVKNLKVVDKAMALPLVSSAYTEVSRVTSPYVESTLNKVSPMVETTWSKVTPVMATVKTQVEEKVIPIIPSKVSETVQNVQTAAVDNITAAVEKVDTFACGGIDQLTEKVPQLKEATPKLIENTKSSVNSYVTSITDYAASFSVSQVALKVIDASLDIVDGALSKVGSDEQGTVRTGFRKIHSTANSIRLTAVKKAGTEKAKKIEEASVIGALIEVSGLMDLLELFGFRLSKNETVYEDAHARVEALKSESEETEPVVVDTQ
eukprot:TRINITY_DN838_c0_g1_i13.p1 TRINITY_DN838_c0_g1~~TRINITY_DN838_c0_g1_i13.p1  ORF type:complete len:293 (-),score=80.04 TRINITY_DN838_c0_g1_i13:89-922(-)